MLGAALGAVGSLFGGGSGSRIDVGNIINTISGGSRDQAAIQQAQREADNEMTKQSILTSVQTNTNAMMRAGVDQIMTGAAQDVKKHSDRTSQGYRA
ncbi:MAG: hypothetical protein MEP57_06750 [Microvirga sp.]|nr:hypothetical protein [Microvirga sp.]